MVGLTLQRSLNMFFGPAMLYTYYTSCFNLKGSETVVTGIL